MRNKGLIIIDGPDATGKTTLAAKLCQICPGSQYVHLTYDEDLNMYAYQLGILKQAIIDSNTRLVVIDRLWISENIYAGIYRGGSSKEFNEHIMDLLAQQAKALYVIAIPNSVKSGMKNHKKAQKLRDEMYGDIAQVCKRYRDFWFGQTNGLNLWGDTLTDRYIRSGGFQSRSDAIRYSIEDHGGNVEEFAYKSLRILETIRGENG